MFFSGLKQNMSFSFFFFLLVKRWEKIVNCIETNVSKAHSRCISVEDLNVNVDLCFPLPTVGFPMFHFGFKLSHVSLPLFNVRFCLFNVSFPLYYVSFLLFDANFPLFSIKCWFSIVQGIFSLFNDGLPLSILSFYSSNVGCSLSKK